MNLGILDPALKNGEALLGVRVDVQTIQSRDDVWRVSIPPFAPCAKNLEELFWGCIHER